jgi:eukaryotic-like serine/threonine-protein kinase
MLYDLQNEMEKLPGSTALRALTIATVVKYLDKLAQDSSRDPSLDLEIANAYERIGSLEGNPYQSNLGHSAAALSHYRQALAIFERLAASPESQVQVINGLINTNLNLGKLESLLGDTTSAASHLRRAAAIAEETFSRRSPEMPLSTQVHVYNLLADAEYQRGAADTELAYYRKALETCEQWAAASHNAEATSNLRDAHQSVGSAQARTGDLYGARASFQAAEQLAEQLARRTDSREEQHYNEISLHNTIGDLLAAPDDPNFGDLPGATAQYETALATPKGWLRTIVRTRMRSEMSQIAIAASV